MTYRSERERPLQIRLRRGALVCLVSVPNVRRTGWPQLAIVASLRLRHLRRWRVYPGRGPATLAPPVPRAV